MTAYTNILISAFIGIGVPLEFLRRCVDGDAILVLSPAILNEFVEVLRRPKFDLTEEQIHAALAALLQIAEVIAIRTRRRFVPEDPDDDMVVQTAIDGKAEYIVSGDRHLLRLDGVDGIQILDVRRFLLLLLKDPRPEGLPPFHRERDDRY